MHRVVSAIDCGIALNPLGVEAQVEGGADAIGAILDPLSAELTTDVLTEMGVRISVDQEDVEDVAASFLASVGAGAASESPAA